MKKALFYLVLAVLLLSPFVILELGLRAVGLGDPILYYANASYRFAPQPGQHKLRRRDSWVTIDDSGLRGPEPWRSPADRRILFIGDSVTWGGTNVDDALTFPALACAVLEGGASLDYVCGNAGVNGYGVDNMTQRLRYGGIEGEDAIVAVIISGDATRGLTAIESGPYLMTPPPAPIRAMWEAAMHFCYRAMLMLRGSTHRDSSHDLPVARESLARLFAVLREKRAQGKTVLLVLAPYETELDGEPSPLTLAVREEMKNSGLPFLDMHPVLAAAPRDRLFVDGVHLDYVGHHLFGETIAAELRRLLPPPG